MRFPVVLFDLDGTLIDSGRSSSPPMRHAAQTVLGREIPDELLGRVGGPGLEAQMGALDADPRDELVAAYRAHNEPLHAELEAFAGVGRRARAPADEGRRLGIVTRSATTIVELAFDARCRSATSSTSSSARTTRRAAQARSRSDPRRARTARRRPADAAYVGDSPFDVEAARAAGVPAVRRDVGRHPRPERLEREGPDALVHTPEELLGVL